MILSAKNPSNKKFGIFFSLLFSLIAIYFFYNDCFHWSYLLFTFAIIFLLLAYLKSNALEIFNKAWMGFGLVLGSIVSPIVLGTIFFLIFSPLAIIMRISGRDELGLKISQKSSSWKKREEEFQSSSFNNQF